MAFFIMAVNKVRKSLCCCLLGQLESTGSTVCGKIHRAFLFNNRSLHTSPFKWNRFARDPNASQFLRNGNSRTKFLRPLIFTISVGATSFIGASIIQYERLRYDMQHANIRPFWMPEHNFGKEIELRDKINKWWNRLTDGHKVVAGIIALNVGVFLSWRIPMFRHFLTKWFTYHPGMETTTEKVCLDLHGGQHQRIDKTVSYVSFLNGKLLQGRKGGRSLPMLLSCFSHAELWHLGCNMFVLWSFAPVIVDILGVEQFVAFYTTGGVVSSLASHYFKNLLRAPSFSLGASGAILAVLAAVCLERPDARLSIIFLPFFSFSASTALMGIIALDFTGLVLRWQMFDHAAHLGGSLFGMWYSKYGRSGIWEKRSTFMRWWHDFRKGNN